MKRFGIVLSSVGVLFLALAVTQHFMVVQVNLSESLPQRFFLVLKDKLVAKGDYVSFYAKQNGLYPTNVPFIKKVAGAAGDKITEKDRTFYVNGKSIALAKQYSKQSRPLAKGPAGTLSNGEYFVYTDHKDSFDSRYKNIGWVHQDAIIGRAIPLF